MHGKSALASDYPDNVLPEPELHSKLLFQTFIKKADDSAKMYACFVEWSNGNCRWGGHELKSESLVFV